jgi:glycosyltransferase involved in cell wall biosynthesis
MNNRMKICLVSNEILGAHKNGGIGTATSHLSILLASLKADVTILYVGHWQVEADHKWVRKYRSLNIKLETLPAGGQRISPAYMSLPIQIFNTLKDRDLDVIIFQDWQALGHSCAVQKSCGKYFQNTKLITIAHSPTAWIAEANQRVLDTIEAVALDHMEREAIRLSDAIIGPSQYLLDWMRAKGWRLPENTKKIPYYFCDEPSAAPSKSQRRDRQSPLREIVFFGRLEERKGIVLFLEALCSKDLTGIEDLQVTFLGREATHTESAIRQYVDARRPGITSKLNFLKSFDSDDAQKYLRSPGRLAVVPSLTDNSPCVIYECTRNEVAFLAAASGGIPEIVRSEDHAGVLFEPTAKALAAKLKDVLRDRAMPAPAKAAHPSEDIVEAWKGVLLDRLSGRRPHASVPTSLKQGGDPSVTVIVTHYERPRLLRQCLHSLELQTTDRFRVIVVDDGSQSEESRSALSALEAASFRMQLRVVRQENRYLGAARNYGVRLGDCEYRHCLSY